MLRYNPAAVVEKKNPLSVDSAPPTDNYEDFLMGEVRYNSLKLKNPERAEKLFTESERFAMDRYRKLVEQKKSLENN